MCDISALLLFRVMLGSCKLTCFTMNQMNLSDDEIKTKKDKEIDLKLVCYKCYLKLKGAVYDARRGFE